MTRYNHYKNTTTEAFGKSEEDMNKILNKYNEFIDETIAKIVKAYHEGYMHKFSFSVEMIEDILNKDLTNFEKAVMIARFTERLHAEIGKLMLSNIDAILLIEGEKPNKEELN